MTPEQVELVEQTFGRIGPITEATGIAFYSKLFEIDDSARALFSADIGGQAMKFMHVVSFAVSRLRAPEQLMPMVRDLGRRHVGYGVADAHYDSIGRALLATLAGKLGADWTPRTEAAWIAAYELIAGEMKSAGQALPPA